jgi:alcohol dehydrogenase class IV
MRFQYSSPAQEVRFGPGELSRLGDHLAALGVRRALLCTSGSYARNGTLDRARAAAADISLTSFDAVLPHVPEDSVDAVLGSAEAADLDAVIGLGGGSAIGTAKAAAYALATRRPDAVVRVVAVPTTYAGSEMTPLFGVTRTAEGRKVTIRDPRVLPALVLYDPELTVDLPQELTASTGINALAHCIEGLYSITRNPVSTATALAGIGAIPGSLPRCVANGRDLEARSSLLAAAWLAGMTIAHVRLALHHGICHVLGGSAGVPHGVANAIMLPHVMRFNLHACVAELAAAGRAMAAGAGDDRASAEAAIAATAALIRDIGLPTRLRDAGVAWDDLPRLAALAMRSDAVQANPLPIADAGQVEGLLRAAW